MAQISSQFLPCSFELKATMTTIDTKNAQLFPQFSNLSGELKWKIWECSIQRNALQPRIIEVLFSEESVLLPAEESEGPEIYDFVADIPPLLHVCHDSRVIALKV